jgi:hypothetical protein
MMKGALLSLVMGFDSGSICFAWVYLVHCMYKRLGIIEPLLQVEIHLNLAKLDFLVQVQYVED